MKLTISPVLLALGLGVSANAANLFWDPDQDNSGLGSGTWTAPARWDTGSLGGAAQTWADNDSASFSGLGGSTANVGNANVLVNNLTILAGANVTIGRSAAGSGSFEVTGATSVSGSLSLQNSSGFASDMTFKFSGSGISGNGGLSLNKQSDAGTNLFVELAGPATSVGNPAASAITIASAGAGMVGFVSTSPGAQLQRGVTNSSVATTYLGATAGNKLELTASISGSSALQVGSSTNTGIVEISSGGSVSAPSINLTDGTLLLSASNVIADTTNLTLSGGTLAFNGNITETLGTLTVTSNSVIDLGSGDVSLRFAASDLSTWTGTLEIWNWTPGVDNVYFGTDDNGLAGMLISPPTVTGWIYAWNPVVGYTDKIRFFTGNPSIGAGGVTNYGSGFGQGWGGEIVPVPEPTAVLSSLLLFLAIGWRERGLFSRSRARAVAA